MADTQKPLFSEDAPHPKSLEADEHSGLGHESIEIDEFDKEFSRNYWKIARPQPETEPEQK
jgi:hypothetical protein